MGAGGGGARGGGAGVCAFVAGRDGGDSRGLGERARGEDRGVFSRVAEERADRRGVAERVDRAAGTRGARAANRSGGGGVWRNFEEKALAGGEAGGVRCAAGRRRGAGAFCVLRGFRTGV